MNLVMVIISIIAILFAIFWAWLKLKDTEEGDLIDIGLGTHLERWAFEVRMALALMIFSIVLLIGLLS